MIPFSTLLGAFASILSGLLLFIARGYLTHSVCLMNISVCFGFIQVLFYVKLLRSHFLFSISISMKIIHSLRLHLKLAAEMLLPLGTKIVECGWLAKLG
ncbi:hypothetical protein BDV12DRAFT_87264 [Aspergillus spectabilis]